MGVASFTVACGCAQQKQQSLYRSAKRRADASAASAKKWPANRRAEPNKQPWRPGEGTIV